MRYTLGAEERAKKRIMAMADFRQVIGEAKTPQNQSYL